MLRVYFKENKARFIKTALWLLVMFIFFLVSYYMKSQNEFYVSVKTKTIVVLCSVASAMLIFFPNRLSKWISIAFEFVLLLLAPCIIFKVLEPLVNDITNVLPKASIFNYLVIVAVLLAINAVLGHIGVALGITSLLLYVLYIVDYYTLKFRGTPFVLSDVLSAKTALGVIGNYSIVFSQEFMVAFYALAILTAFASWVSKKKNSSVVRVSEAICGLLIAVGIVTYILGTDALEKNGLVCDTFIPRNSALRNGFPVNSVCALKQSFISAPKGYSEKKVEEIIEKYSSKEKNTEVNGTPNIIVIMNESFTDLKYLENVEYSEEPIPKFKTLSENCVRGTLVSSIYGGNTPNSEFEFLTGCSLAFLPAGIVTYQQIISEPLSTFTTQVENESYQTSAIHLYNPEYFSRSRIYPLLGFDEFININNATTEVELFNDYAYDWCSFEAIKEQDRRSKEKPIFAFCVTIQNHGGYWHWLRDILVTNVENDYVNDYVSLIRMTDDSFSELLDYYSKESEPTIIVMYGDHQPNLPDEFYDEIWAGRGYTDAQKTIMKAKVPFIIWANYDIEEKDVGTISINYLGPLVMETAGLPMSDYYSYLNRLREELPVVSAAGCYDRDGNYFLANDAGKYEELLREYEYLQYNYLKGNKNKEFYR